VCTKVSKKEVLCPGNKYGKEPKKGARPGGPGIVYFLGAVMCCRPRQKVQKGGGGGAPMSKGGGGISLVRDCGRGGKARYFRLLCVQKKNPPRVFEDKRKKTTFKRVCFFCKELCWFVASFPPGNHTHCGSSVVLNKKKKEGRGAGGGAVWRMPVEKYYFPHRAKKNGGPNGEPTFSTNSKLNKKTNLAQAGKKLVFPAWGDRGGKKFGDWREKKRRGLQNLLIVRAATRGGGNFLGGAGGGLGISTSGRGPFFRGFFFRFLSTKTTRQNQIAGGGGGGFVGTIFANPGGQK